MFRKIPPPAGPSGRKPSLFAEATEILGLWLLLWALCMPAASAQESVFEDSFESGDLLAWSSFSPQDNGVPTLSIDAPGPLVEDRLNPEIILSYDDSETGIAQPRLWIQLDRVNIADTCVTAATGAVCRPLVPEAGSHTITVQVFDQGGNPSVVVDRDFSIVLTGDAYTATLPASADAFLWATRPNRNFGALDQLAMGEGPSRPILAFDGAQITALAGQEPIAEARLEWRIADNAGGWPVGSELRLFPLTTPWRELEATWDCPVDESPGSPGITCSTSWAGGAIEGNGKPVAISDGDDSSIAFDVTSELTDRLTAGSFHGWLLKKADEGAPGSARLGSREAIARLRPRLHLTFGVGDQTPPTLSILSPTDGEVLINPQDPAVRLSFADAESGIDTDSLRLVVGFSDLSARCSSTADGVLCPLPPLGSGARTIQAEISDLAGNTTSVQSSFDTILDQAAPRLVWSNPVTDSIGTPTLSFELGDVDTAIETGSFRLLLDGDEVTDQCLVDAESALCSPNALAEGDHLLRAEVRDLAGLTTAIEATFRVEIDEVNPTLVLTAPTADNLIQAAPPVWVRLDWSDDDLGVDEDSLSLQLDSVEVAEDCLPREAGADCPVSPAAGDFHLVALVRDRAGNATRASGNFSVTYDDQAPIVQISAPSVDEVSMTADVNVELTYGDGESGLDLATFDLLVDGASRVADCAADAAGASCLLAGLAEGRHDLVAEIRDVAGNLGTEVVPFEVLIADRQAPEITVLSPIAGPLVGLGSPAIEAQWSDPSGVDSAAARVLVDGADITASCQIGGDGVSCPPSALATGEHSVFISVADNEGNLATATVAFQLELALPVEITSPAAGTLTRDLTVSVEGTVNEAAESVEVNGVEAVVAGASFVASEVPLQEGSNVLVAVARNSLGALGTASASLVRDTEAPRLRLTSPPDGFVSQEPQVVVTGEVSNPTSSISQVSGPTVTVNGVSASVEQRAFALTEFLLQPGDNVLRAEAIDQAGNVGSHEIVVTYLPDAEQKIEEMLGNDQTAPVGSSLPRPLVVRLVDFLDRPLVGRAVSFEVTRGDGHISNPPVEGRRLEVTTDEKGFAQVFFTLGSRSGSGNHEVTASAAGVPGQVIFCAGAEPGPATRIVRVVGDVQLGAMASVVGEPAPFPLYTQVFDSLGNPVPGVDVTYRVTAGDGTVFDDRGDGVKATDAVTVTDDEGKAWVRTRLGPLPGIDGHRIVARFEGLGESPAVFQITGLVPGPEELTGVSGVVLDNQDRPVPAATISIPGAESAPGVPLMTLSDAQGRFSLAPAPVGMIHLDVDGATTTLAGDWPHLEFIFTTVAGQDNTLGKPIRLLPLDTAGAAVVGGDQDVTLRLAGVPGAELTVFADSVTFPDGSHEGQLSFTQVHSDKVPMEAPMGSDFMLAWTVQPPGTRFDPPARIAIPNSDLPAGAVVDIFSFDHDVGEFIPVGTASVTEDGSQLVSNPGFGMVKAGWHGCAPPPPPSGDSCKPGTCTVCGADGLEPKCTDCETCKGGGCEPKTIESVTAEANGHAGDEVEVVVGRNQEVDFFAEIDGNCNFHDYDWDLGPGGRSSDATPSYAFEEVGVYPIKVKVSCRKCPMASAEDELELNVIVVDLVLDGLPEEDEPSPNEEDPGRLILVNDDDDDGDKKEDKDQASMVTGEDDLVRFEIDLGEDSPQDGELRLEAAGGQVKVWEEETKGTRVELPKTWDLASDSPPAELWLEGIRSSDDFQDIDLRLTFIGDAAPEPIEDVAKVTVLDLDFEALPAEPTPISADLPSEVLSASVFHKKLGDPKERVAMKDDTRVEWRLLEGSGSLPASSNTEDGRAVVELTTSTSPGDTYVAEATLTSFELREGPSDQPIEVDRKSKTESLTVGPGDPAEIQISGSTAAYAGDGVAKADFGASVFDSAGNPVADGTPVTWRLGTSTNEYETTQGETSGGQVAATLRAPLEAIDQQVIVAAGEATATTTIRVSELGSSLTSSTPTLDVATSQSATLTVNVSGAADGTEVFWTTSNGSLTATTMVSGGSSTNTLSTTAGSPGPVMVTATIGNELLSWQGKLVSSATSWVSVSERFVATDVSQTTRRSFMRFDGSTRGVDVAASTEVTLHGAPGMTAVVSLPGLDTLESFTFDALTAGGEAPGVFNGLDMTLSGAELDTATPHMGAASLAFDAGDTGTLPGFDWSAGLGVRLWIRPASGGAQSLVTQDGVFTLETLSDGRVRATVGTDTVTSSRVLSPGVWQRVSLTTSDDELRLEVGTDGEYATAALSAPPAADVSPLVFGGFSGHLDDLSLFQASGLVPSSFSAAGLDGAGTVQLDSNGEATFELRATGTFNPGEYKAVPYVLSFVPVPTSQALRLSAGLRKAMLLKGDDEKGETEVYQTESSTWATIKDVVGSFFGGDPQTTAGTIANVAGGVLIVGDIGAIVKNLWRMAGFSDKDPNYPELVLSTLGLITEFAVGAGEVVDVPISAAKAIVARIGNSPLARIMVKRLKDWITKGKVLLDAEIDLLKLMKDNTGLADSFNRFIKSEDVWMSAVKICQKFPGAGLQRDDGEERAQAVEAHATILAAAGRVADDLGEEIAAKMAKTFGDLSDDAARALGDLPTNQLDEAIDGAAKTLKHVDSALMTRILNSRHLYTDSYKQVDLLRHLGRLEGFDGFAAMVNGLKRRSPSVKGYRYEVEAAIHLLDQGADIRFLGKAVEVSTPAGRRYTDIDIVANGLAYQAKRSRSALKNLKSVELWVDRIKKKGGFELSDIRYIMPPGVNIPDDIQKFFTKNGIKVVRVETKAEPGLNILWRAGR